MADMEDIMKLEQFGRITLLLGAFGLAAAVTGCASRSAMSFHVAVPVAAAAAPSAAQPESVAQPEPAAQAEPEPIAVSIGTLPADDVALLDNELSLDSEIGFQLAQHAPEALSFHCTAGEESLGCAARPAVTEQAPEPTVTDEPIILARNSKQGAAQ